MTIPECCWQKVEHLKEKGEQLLNKESNQASEMGLNQGESIRGTEVTDHD